MPRATANLQETEHHDLKTLAGGYVVLRRLTYGEKIQRRAMTGSMKVHQSKGQKDFQGEMQLINEAATLFDFQRCIVDHNLTRVNPQDPDNEDADLPIDFGNREHIRQLDPKVGEEIDNLLNELNNFDDEDDLGN